ncbi:MAG TPA: STAS domain-containing protein [Solirubrobacteraceae bacterium]|jgi:anti-sigma B factor antagonist|nr:STAS domain-containing protein [Solirubrobacteraceae bacterium]
MDHPFTVDVEPLGGGRVVVAVGGEVDLYTAPKLKAALSEQIGNGLIGVIVDLGSTSFLDSSGLGVLIGALRALRERDAELVLVNRNPSIARTMSITGLDRVFTLVDSRAAAEGELGTGAP